MSIAFLSVLTPYDGERKKDRKEIEIERQKERSPDI
jgi:hypothetical protein